MKKLIYIIILISFFLACENSSDPPVDGSNSFSNLILNSWYLDSSYVDSEKTLEFRGIKYKFYKNMTFKITLADGSLGEAEYKINDLDSTLLVLGIQGNVLAKIIKLDVSSFTMEYNIDFINFVDFFHKITD